MSKVITRAEAIERLKNGARLEVESHGGFAHIRDNKGFDRVHGNTFNSLYDRRCLVKRNSPRTPWYRTDYYWKPEPPAETA